MKESTSIQDRDGRSLEYNKFGDWFSEVESYGLRSERFYEALNMYRLTGRPEIIKKWLRTAFEAGRSTGS